MEQDKQALIDFIKNNSPTPDQIVQEIVSHFEYKSIPKNGFFLKSGKVSNEYLFLEEGVLRAFTLAINGDEVTTNFYTKNRVVFEASSFFIRTVSKENIQALTDCKGFSITYEKLNMLFHSIPEFREFGRAMLVKEFATFKARTLSSITETAEEQYANLLAGNPEIFQYVPLKYIASYLGITDSSLSRIRRGFSKK
jgi:CRP-like cAMP-binding protein